MGVIGGYSAKTMTWPELRAPIGRGCGISFVPSNDPGHAGAANFAKAMTAVRPEGGPGGESG